MQIVPRTFYLVLLHYFCKVLVSFQSHIEQEFPELPKKQFLLACSGGMDSVVLVHLCHALKMDFSIAHCNFRLRGAESEGDEEFARNLANQLNKTYFITHFDTIGYVNKNKVSVQVAARELRYHWFAEIMQQNGMKTLVTAHHADDNLETFLINLSRGTGIEGLTGIPAKNETIARPLLKFSRHEILDYAKKEGLQWREDSSNAETKYLRNKIREKIVPRLKELHPTFLQNFLQSQEYLQQTSDIAKNHVESLRPILFEKEGVIIKVNIVELQKLNPLKAYIYALFKEYGFTEWNNVLALLTAMSGKEVRSKTHRLVKDRDFLLLSELVDDTAKIYSIEENQTSVQRPLRLTIQEVANIDGQGKNVLFVDKETLNYPLLLRKWQKGDYFYPLGMKGKKSSPSSLRTKKLTSFRKTHNGYCALRMKSYGWLAAGRMNVLK